MPKFDLYIPEINNTIHFDSGEHDVVLDFNWRWHVSYWLGNDMTVPFTVPPPHARIKKTMTAPRVEIENSLSDKYKNLLTPVII
jgi:hypothetical protein